MTLPTPKPLVLFWFRRDLRLDDNHGLSRALEFAKEHRAWVQPIFIFDPIILDKIQNPSDRRVPFIHQTLTHLQKKLHRYKTDLWTFHDTPLTVFQSLEKKHTLKAIFCNHDYEPYPLKRDQTVSTWAQENKIVFSSFKDQVLVEKNELLNLQKKPYTVFTPYKKQWLERLTATGIPHYDLLNHKNFFNPYASEMHPIASLERLGFQPILENFIPPLSFNTQRLSIYDQTRDFPSHSTSKLGVHLRFGTVSARECIQVAQTFNATFLSELIWREFFMQILFHFPFVISQSFKKEYDQIAWRENEQDFERWKTGTTGYPLVDAGMRELNATGFMHNRVRMVTASFLCKHLLIHWSQGERYFARHLLDYDLSANNGNWQWAAGTGCDAAPYFRVFNPLIQQKKFDPGFEYIEKWVPEYKTSTYPKPMVEHAFARERALRIYKEGLRK